GLRPQTPPHHCREAIAEGRRQTAPRVIPAAESALGLRPRIALSSAQVFPEWTTSTSPCNNFSPNGDYPLNFLSHVWGSLHCIPCIPCSLLRRGTRMARLVVRLQQIEPEVSLVIAPDRVDV